MHNYLLPILSSAFLFGACMGDDNVGTADSHLEACDCSMLELAAADVSYDNASSELAGTTVQGAVDEIASAQANLDFADRISVVDADSSDTPSNQIAVVAGCPQVAEGEPGYRAIGGGCSTDASNVTMTKSELADSAYRCEWDKPLGQATTVSARVVCLSLLP